MGRHRSEHGHEQAAAGPHGRQAAARRWLNRSSLAGAVVVVVLVVVTTIWAFSGRNRSADGLSPGATESATRGARDGFGQAAFASGGPSADPTTQAGRPSRTPSASPPPVSGVTPSVQPASPPQPNASTPDTALTARYTMSSWQGAYKLEFVIVNRTAAASLWTVRLEVPSGARVAQTWNVEVSQQSATVWQLKPPRWDGGNPRPVPAGGEFLFGLIVQDGQTVVSCTIDGRACQH